MSIGSPNIDGVRTVFFKVNGQTRNVEIADNTITVEKVENKKVEPEATNQIGAPLQGMLSKLLVEEGQAVKKNDPLFVIEAMKMESTVAAIEDGQVKIIHLKEGTMVKSDDLVVSLE